MINIDFAFYFAIFRSRAQYFFAVFVAVALIGVLVAYTLPPVYRATAKILVELPQIPTDLARSTVPTSAIEQFQIIQEDVLSRESLVELAERFSIYADTPNLSEVDIADDMKWRISISPVPLEGAGTIIFEISFQAGEPELAAAVTNELVAMILAKDIKLRNERAGDTVQFFSQEAARLDRQLKLLDSQILEFKKSNIDALPDSLAFRRERQSSLQQRLLLLTQEELSLNRRKASLLSRRVGNGTEPATPEEQALAEIRRAIVAQSELFSDQSPSIRTLKARAAALESQIVNGAEEADDATVPAVLSVTDLEFADIDDQLAAVAREAASIHKTIDELDLSILATPANETALNAMVRRHETLEAQYDAAVTRLAEASTGQQIELRLKGQRLSLIESAVAPQSALGPRPAVKLLAGFVGALGLATAAIALPELLNRRIRRPVELVERMQIRPLMTIPYIATGFAKQSKKPQAIRSKLSPMRRFTGKNAFARQSSGARGAKVATETKASELNEPARN